MEIQFESTSSADGGRLAEELELELIRSGVPAKTLSLKRSSSEAMDPGTVLWAGVETAAHMFGAAGYIACFVKCIYDVAKRNQARNVVIATKKGSVKLPLSRLSMDLIKTAIEGNVGDTEVKKKTKRRPKQKAKAART